MRFGYRVVTGFFGAMICEMEHAYSIEMELDDLDELVLENM